MAVGPVAVVTRGGSPHPIVTMAGATCERCSDLLGDYVDEVLSSTDHAALSTHLLSCPQCRELLASYRAIPDIVREATDVRIPGALRARLRWLLRW